MMNKAMATAASVARVVKALVTLALLFWLVWVAARGWPVAMRATALGSLVAVLLGYLVVDHADARARDELVARIGIERNRAQAASAGAGDALAAAMESSGGLAGLVGAMVTGGPSGPPPAPVAEESPAPG